VIPLTLTAVFAFAIQEPGIPPADVETQLVHLVRDWIQAKVQEQPQTLNRIENEILEFVEEGTAPLSNLSLWERVFERAPSYPPKTKGKIQMDHLKKTGEPVFWRAPSANTDSSSLLPLTIVCGKQDGQSLLENIPLNVAEQALLVAMEFPNPASSETHDATRIQFLHTFSFAVHNFRVNRNEVSLLSDLETHSQARLLSDYFPHFFASVLTLPSGEVPLEFWNRLMRPLPRQPYPTDFLAEFHIPSAGRNYWVQALQYDLPDQAGQPAFVRVRVDQQENAIHLLANKVYSVDLFLNDAIVDLNKPISIFRNGAPLQFKAVRNLRTLLDNFALNLDARAVFPVVVHGIDIPRSSP
jgi:hypothetical protein